MAFEYHIWGPDLRISIQQKYDTENHEVSDPITELNLSCFWLNEMQSKWLNIIFELQIEYICYIQY